MFFRLWATQTIDTDYQIGSTYPSTPDGKGEPGFPLVGTGHGTIPFFASGNQGANADYGPGGPNIATVTIPAGRDSMWAYYGCFLNVYDAANVIDGKPVQAYLTGTHHCLVAQIAYDDAPVIAGVSPDRRGAAGGRPAAVHQERQQLHHPVPPGHYRPAVNTRRRCRT